MAPRPRRNPPRSAGHSDPSELWTPTPSDVAPPAVPPPDAPPPAPAAPAEARYTKADLQRLTRLCMESFLQVQANRPEPGSCQKGLRELQGSFRYRRRLWHQHERRNQAVNALSPWSSSKLSFGGVSATQRLLGISSWSRQDNSHLSFECGAYEPLYTRDIELIQD